MQFSLDVNHNTKKQTVFLSKDYQSTPLKRKSTSFMNTNVLKSMFAKACIVACLSSPSVPTTAAQPNVVVKNKVEKTVGMEVFQEKIKHQDNEKNLHTDIKFLSKELQAGFGFKTAQWAYVLKVERKTLYNWSNNPKSKPHAKTFERLQVLKKFRDGMDFEHSLFISKVTFDRNLDNGFSQAFGREVLDIHELNDLYDKNYITIDGMYKRSLHAIS